MKEKRIYLLAIFCILIFFQTNSYAAEQKEGILQFPNNYQPYLLELQKKHPNWEFIALYTDLDWKYVIDQENQFGKNLVPKSYSDSWKNTNPGEYNVEVDAGWVDCSRNSLEYTMDPRNFLNEVRIFQFERLSYQEKTNHLDGIEKILYGTEFYNQIVEYVDNQGNWITMNERYSDLILKAGKQSKVSCYHLASRIKQEVGPFLSHSSISGKVEGFEGLYNFYNIGATSSSEPMGAIKNGLRYARDGKGASQTTKDKYLIPWNNKEKAITGGGIFIGSSYIHLGQDTIYLQKFHVYTNSDDELFWHQYMTNVLAPYSESKSIYQGYSNTGMLKDNLSFIIPVYQNMTEIPTQSPNIKEEEFIPDQTKVYADVSTTLNIRTGPSTSYEILTAIDRNVIMTRIAKGKQPGELWDRVQLSNGMIGYAFQNYLKEIPEKQIEQINLSIDDTILKKGDSKKIKVEILPQEARDQAIEYQSDNTKIVTVDQSGNLLGIKSGKATITVKAKSNNVFNTLEVQVYTPVTDLQIDVEKQLLQKGDSVLLKPIVLPEDADNPEVCYFSEDENIATVDETGKITALKEGSCKIKIQTIENKIEKEVQIIVVSKLEENEIRFDQSLKIEQNQITGWDIQTMSVKEIKEKIDTIYTIEIYDFEGKKLEETEKAGTGAVIQILDENRLIKMEYQIVLYGDLNGDGKINSVDLLVLQRHILEIEKLKGCFLKAGNINKNGKNPSSLDSLLIQQHILELKMIQQ